MRAETYADFAVQRAVAVARVTGSASSVGRAGPVIVEAAIRSTPHSALPVFRYGLILGLSRRELEPSLSGSVPVCVEMPGHMLSGQLFVTSSGVMSSLRRFSLRGALTAMWWTPATREASPQRRTTAHRYWPARPGLDEKRIVAETAQRRFVQSLRDGD